MKTNIVLIAVVIMTMGLVRGYSQSNPTIDEKLSIMKEIESLPEIPGHPIQEWWKKARDVEDFSLFFGYSSYGIPCETPALHGGTLGVSKNRVMLGFDLGIGSIIDDSSYDNTNVYNYLKANTTQGFWAFSVHYYLIKYLSFGAGVVLHSELQKNVSNQIDQYNNYTIEIDKISFKNNWLLGVRVGAKAYIPISNLSPYLSVNYDIIPDNISKSTISLGIGVKIAID